MTTYNFEPLLLCPVRRCAATCDPPAHQGARGPSAPLLCPECGAQMMLIEYAVLDGKADLNGMFRAVPMRGELRR